MKKHNLFKVVGITILVTFLLTWIFPITYFDGTDLAKVENYKLGLFDLFSYPVQSLGYFSSIIMFVLIVGIFYGVLHKTGAYEKILNVIAKKAQGKEKIIISIIMILIALFTSISGAHVGILLIVPFIVSLVLLMGYDKMTAAMVTIGSIAVGVIGTTISSTYVVDPTGYSGTLAQNGMGVVNSHLGSSATDHIVLKIGILVLGLVLLIFNTLKYANKNKAVSNFIEYEEKCEKKPVMKKSIVSSVIFQFLTFGIYRWIWYFKIVSDVKKISKEDELPKLWKVVLLTIVTLGFYSWYVYYKIGKSISIDSKKEDKAILYLILAIVAPLIANIIIQLKLNEYGIDYREEENKRFVPIVPAIVIIDLIFVVMVLSQISWTSVLGVDLFDKMTTAITNFKVFGFPIFAKVLGTVGVFEQWSLDSITVMLVLGTALLALIYRVKINDFIDSMADGVKKALKPAILILLIYTILLITYSYPFILTIVKPLISKNIFFASIAAFISSIFNTELIYAASSVLPYHASVLTNLGLDIGSSIAFVWQVMYGFVTLIAPTSVILITILSYLDVSYGKWLKSNWKFLIEMCLLIGVSILVVALI